MNFSTFFSQQARKPSGMAGRFIAGPLFEKGNHELNALMFKTLSVSENDYVLEIGFGTGKLINEIAHRIKNGVIEGVDFSKIMVDSAKKKNMRHIKTDKVKIFFGDFDKVHFKETYYDKILTVNTIYFWENPETTISKINRLLKPGGKVFIGLNEKSEMEKLPLDRNVMKFYSMQDIKDLLLVHGAFDSIEIISKHGKRKTNYCVVGTKLVT